MIRNRSILSGVLALIVAAGTAFAQNQNCPRANCPNPGQNCPRNGQCMRQGNAKGGPGAMNRGMRRGAGMRANCGGNQAGAAATADQQNTKK
jgi:hypothetical protein